MTNALLVLDLDQTLIDYRPKFNSSDFTSFTIENMGAAIERPFLDKFIQFAFENFRYVAIYSAAHEKWVHAVLSQSPSLGKYYDQFAFIWDSSKMSYFVDNSEEHPLVQTHKPLKKIWRRTFWKERGITKDNTLIVDDLIVNAFSNFGNFICIPEFDVEKSDKLESGRYVLSGLMNYLKDLLIYLDKNQTIRSLEKRGWVRQY